MNDRYFFSISKQLFLSYFYKKKPENMEVINEAYWSFATQKMEYALAENPRLIHLMKLIYQEEKITPNVLLNLLFTTLCRTRAMFNKIIQKPDEWGKGLIWPFHESGLVKLEDWASPEILMSMHKSLNMELQAKSFNALSREETFIVFPKVYKRIGHYYQMH